LISYLLSDLDIPSQMAPASMAVAMPSNGKWI
jgi:hypothetical protein